MSFGRAILAAFAQHGERVAIVTERDEISFATALGEIRNLASNFRAHGVGHGDYVGLAMVDTADVLLGIMACWLLSATPVPVDFRWPRAQRASLSADFNFRVVFEDFAPPGDEIYPGAPFDRTWRYAASPGPELPASGDDSGPAFLLFSSGTTGVPKAFVQTHEGLSRRIESRKELIDTSEMRFLTPLALTYSATRHHTFGYLLGGGAVRLYPPLFSPSELIEALLEFGATGTALPPSVVARLVREVGPRSEPLFPRLASLTIVGGPARPADKVAAYHRLSPGYRMGYASTLTGMIATLSGDNVLKRPDATGKIVSSARLEILDGEGRALPTGETGLIKAWTPSVPPALLGPGRREYIDPQIMGPGWGIPGDLGFVDDQGFLTLVDRQADMIVRGGVNVSPLELEKLIAAHPKVAEVGVVGVADETMGQEIVAYIVSDNGTVEEFIAFLRSSIAPDRRPREVRLVRALPYNDNGKLMRRQLAEGYEAEASERKSR